MVVLAASFCSASSSSAAYGFENDEKLNNSISKRKHLTLTLNRTCEPSQLHLRTLLYPHSRLHTGRLRVTDLFPVTDMGLKGRQRKLRWLKMSAGSPMLRLVHALLATLQKVLADGRQGV